ncbi:ArsC/Spx/MgsR family protein [Aquilutibacter rugosus]|uniref:ArsC/Spx/MgsR family protein n=1 Tax=Aquilutibacter rugosus TaxID=3115820 RepID=UPI002F40B5E2
MKLFGLANCDTCRKARKRYPYAQFVDYRDEPIAPSMLLDWAGQVGGFEKLINKASPTWRGLPSHDFADNQAWLQVLAENPTLIRRPVLLLDDGQIRQGRDV